MQKKKTKGAEIRKKKEKDRAEMESRRDETINTHPFSHPWPTNNKTKGGFHIFPSSN